MTKAWAESSTPWTTQIKGKPGRVLLASDARRRTFHSTEWAGIPGKNVVLTLDEKIQYIAEKALAEEVANAHAAGGVAIVQNPNTGRNSGSGQSAHL